MVAFRSEIRPLDTVIWDDADLRRIDTRMARGRVARDWTKQPYGALDFAEAFSLPVIPRNEWQARIEEMEKTKTKLSDLVNTQRGIPPKNQQNTNFCWCNAVVTSIEAMRTFAGLPYAELSPASVAAPVTGYRNVGGWGGEALDYIIKNGIAETKYWPANAISRQYDTAESQANRLLYKVQEWWELSARNFDQKMTLLLNRIPVPSGYNWMGHEMCSFDPMYFGGNDFGCRDRNSWGNNQEWYVLHENRGTPDDAVAPRVIMATAA